MKICSYCGNFSKYDFCYGHKKLYLQLQIPQKCECGCGQMVKFGNRFINGHNSVGKEPANKRSVPLSQECECGCGVCAKPGKRFIHGHTSAQLYVKEKISKSNIGKHSYLKGPKTEAHKRNIGQALKGRVLTDRQKIALDRTGKSPAIKGQKHTSLTKQKMSIAKRKYFLEHPDVKISIGLERQQYFHDHPEKHPYNVLKINGIRQESYPERKFREFIESLSLVKDMDFHTEYQVGRYFLDFAFTNQKIGIEIDGKQHKTEIGILHDIKRDAYLSELGWKMFRFPVNKIFYQLVC